MRPGKRSVQDGAGRGPHDAREEPPEPNAAMNDDLRDAFDQELCRARERYGAGAWPQAFTHLERAHILGQRFFGPHLLTHASMLRVALRRGALKEGLAQVLRLVAVFPGAMWGWVPLGNTGGGDVSALAPMPLPDDLAPLLAGVEPDVRFRRTVLVATVLVAAVLVSVRAGSVP